MGLGVVFVNQLLKWEAQVEQDLDKMLEKAKAANERRYIGMFLHFPLFRVCSNSISVPNSLNQKL
jgi:hypothetical protein